MFSPPSLIQLYTQKRIWLLAAHEHTQTNMALGSLSYPAIPTNKVHGFCTLAYQTNVAFTHLVIQLYTASLKWKRGHRASSTIITTLLRSHARQTCRQTSRLCSNRFSRSREWFLCVYTRISYHDVCCILTCIVYTCALRRMCMVFAW